MLSVDQLMGILRAIIPGIAAAIAHWGLGTDAQNTAILTAAATGLSMAWSTYSNSQNSMIRSVNADQTNGVKVVKDTEQVPQVDAVVPIPPAAPKPYSP